VCFGVISLCVASQRVFYCKRIFRYGLSTENFGHTLVRASRIFSCLSALTQFRLYDVIHNFTERFMMCSDLLLLYKIFPSSAVSPLVFARP